MADLCRSSNFEEDPLHAYSGLSLFPRTLKSLSIPLPRLYQSDDLEQMHTLLESMPLEIHKDHLEQAKAILDDSSELLKEGTGTSVASEDPKMNPITTKRERRPGLDRKRGHFSFEPTTSQPPQNEPTFDGSKYPKPEDYFAAYERYENAKRQWQKYTGSSVTDTHQNKPSRRPRRPGLPGRERGSFKLTCTDSDLTGDINLEASEKENPISCEQNLESTTAAHVTTADREVDDSTVDTDKNLKNILTELLACTPGELEGDGAIKLLEERLQIKPIVVEKFSIPEIQDVRQMVKASVSSPPNRRTALSEIQNLLKGMNSVSARKNSQSPSSNPSKDQFSFSDSYYLLPGDKQASEVDLANDLNICYRSSVTNDADKAITNASPSNVGTLHAAKPFKSSVQKSSNEDGSDTRSSPDRNADNLVDDGITSRDSATVEVYVDIQTKGNEGDVAMSESDANRSSGRRENDGGINEESDELDSLAEDSSREVARKDLFTVEEDSIPYQQEEISSKSPEQYKRINGSFEHSEGQDVEENDKMDTGSGLGVESGQEEVDNTCQEETKKRRSRESCEKRREKRRKTVHNESGAKKQMKRVTRESKIYSRRKSLAGAGTKWESGFRRSTRVKSRPLEYWKGERFLFGRIHESLATVIGIKYESPGKEKGGLKVKSFVSDDYKELIDLAALH